MKSALERNVRQKTVSPQIVRVFGVMLVGLTIGLLLMYPPSMRVGLVFFMLLPVLWGYGQTGVFFELNSGCSDRIILGGLTGLLLYVLLSSNPHFTYMSGSGYLTGYVMFCIPVFHIGAGVMGGLLAGWLMNNATSSAERRLFSWRGVIALGMLLVMFYPLTVAPREALDAAAFIIRLLVAAGCSGFVVLIPLHITQRPAQSRADVALVQRSAALFIPWALLTSGIIIN